MYLEEQLQEHEPSEKKKNTVHDDIDTKYAELIQGFMTNQALREEQEEEKEGGVGWQGEVYERWHRPRGYDKAFKRFSQAVQDNPDHCLR